MAARRKIPRLVSASAWLLQSFANASESPPRRLSLGDSRLLSASVQLNNVVEQGLSVVNRSSSARPRELTDRFPFLQNHKKSQAKLLVGKLYHAV